MADTSEEFAHGKDVKITKKNIKEYLAEHPDCPADSIVKAFIHFPKERHFSRVRRMMSKK